MRVIEAPNQVEDGLSIFCFLAGGIQKCNWHSSVINALKEKDPIHLTLINPKREVYPEGYDEVVRQISWEYTYLNKWLDDDNYIFSMYFDNSESPQPICFYELGKYAEKAKNKVISVHPEFFRKDDVIIQCMLAGIQVNECTSRKHAELIYREYLKIKHTCQGFIA